MRAYPACFLLSSVVDYQARVEIIMIYTFFDSNFFVALVTFMVGSFAIGLYTTQKRDYKRDAASIILMEVRHAEKIIERMKLIGVSVSVSTDALLPTNNWPKYNYLFIKDLDRDELDLINNFYNQCSMIDNALTQMGLSKQLEAKAGYIHETLAKIASSSISMADYENKKRNFLDLIQNDPYVFQPTAPINLIGKSLGSLSSITTSTAGARLKRIAKMD